MPNYLDSSLACRSGRTPTTSPAGRQRTPRRRGGTAACPERGDRHWGDQAEQRRRRRRLLPPNGGCESPGRHCAANREESVGRGVAEKARHHRTRGRSQEGQEEQDQEVHLLEVHQDRVSLDDEFLGKNFVY